MNHHLRPFIARISGSPTNAYTWGLLSVCLIAWFGCFSGGCSAPLESRCDDAVCEVTVNRACTADLDCCCSQSCTQGRCKASGGESSKSESGTETTTQEGIGPDAGKPDDRPVDQPTGNDTPGTPETPFDSPLQDVPGGPCTGNETRPCYAGPDGTEGVGECKAGTQSCINGQWGSCEGQITPAQELCDGKDNNCDGSIDEPFSNLGKPCQQGVGECQAEGKFVCASDGNDAVCDATPGKPQDETCDGKDNNCDGQIDEGCDCKNDTSQSCYSGNSGCKADTTGYSCVPPCRSGVQKCKDKKWGACEGEITPQKELCDGIDNDCDGVIDNGFADKGKACSVGQGPCASSGKWVCKADHSGLECDARVISPGKEICDNKDNDCDGKIDNGFPTKGQACTGGQGPCAKAGKLICKADGTGVECDAAGVSPTVEVCDGKDNDCDGQIDEGFDLGLFCAVGQGGCRAEGKQICRPDGRGNQCNVTAKPSKLEECNNIDDDCDGFIDENVTRPCYAGPSNTANVGICRVGVQTCSQGNWGSCQGDITPRSSESCGNGLDDDCDGQIDEGCSCSNNSTQRCGSDTGECRRGTQSCQGGGGSRRWGSCQGEIKPAKEICDGKDNDCDGRTDEYWPAKGRNCTVGVGECLRGGTQVCKSDGSGLECSAKPGSPSPEICDGKDNNCNGMVDENCP